jgi:hypothetical protein
MTLDTIIVALAGGFAGVFIAAWLWAPALRTWLEAPKYGIQASVRRYDRVCHPEARAERTTTS